MTNSILPTSFYQRDPVQVARNLLGQCLVRLLDGQRIAGIIIETEAYGGEEDLASHARTGRTVRNQVMFGEPGLAYIYFIYGMHWCLNAVTGETGQPSAVLIRALQPVEGLSIIAERRGKAKPIHWTDGPAKLCQALAIDGKLNGQPLTDKSSGLWIETAQPVPDHLVLSGPRVGVDYAPEPWRSSPWRFRVKPRG